MPKSKVITAEEAAALVESGSTLAISGSGGGLGEPTALMRALGERFASQGTPKELTLCHATGLGDQDTIGNDLLAYEGLVRRDIAGHLGMAPKMAKLISENKLEAYNFPQGVLCHMFAAVAGKKPGVITKVGLGTYIDPRLEGGKMNEVTTEDLVRVVEFDGEEWLYWRRFHFDVAFIRGTTADELGNISFEEEGALLEGIHVAQAVRNCGGVVIAQVKYLAEAGSLDPMQVRIPGIYVDHIVVDPKQKQTTLDDFNPAFNGRVRVPMASIKPRPLDAKKVISRRAAQELFEGAVVNLGFGVPDGIAAVAAEEGILDQFTLTVEQGAVGGQPAGGVIFGVAYNPQAIISEVDQFSFYDGGGLDVAFLGMAQTDSHGNVNTSKLGSRLTGCGGFINITQNAKKVVFCGTFTTKGFKATVGDGKIVIDQEGEINKFVDHVDQVTFSGEYAGKKEQSVLYVTERAVFELTSAGTVRLTEIAPGIDLEKDILERMSFAPEVADPLPQMDSRFFQ